ncbi:hypothetical protein PG996_011258 [Apiospora saccharicola]|uniref:BHLH domain-containing protein n=1 Tax=Apiospora saccharicola TaxID=335842 RepID=A0ABR1UGT4_9PEZI
MKGDTKVSAPARASRTQTISYVDLMKPDEDWRNLPDASERRKIQNRLAQRAYSMSPFLALNEGANHSFPSTDSISCAGRNMRDRTREVERLKNQLKKLQESKQEGEEAPALTQEDEDFSGSDSGSSTTSAKGDTEAQMDDLNQSTIATSEWLGRYFQAWPESAESERAGCMDISPSGDSLAHLNDAACYADYQLSPDFPQQIVPPRPMLSKTQDLVPGHSALAHQQQQSMQANRAMNESMFYPKAAYQIPWPNHNQRNVAFEPMGNPIAPEQGRRMTLPSPPTSLGQPEAFSGRWESQRDGPGIPTFAHLRLERPSLAPGQALITVSVDITFAAPITVITTTASTTAPPPTAAATTECYRLGLWAATSITQDDTNHGGKQLTDLQTKLFHILRIDDTEATITGEIAGFGEETEAEEERRPQE